ncbi:LysR substrate-binding domain-containing protein [Rhizobium sp. BK251]|uniref:LysR substrate-binding domain-containing protein n=1 Tax=Rhizobium sp. BK251 TaxID=2512125 RepID=UPI00104E1EC3|nr:LysR substrate-binding domain-containing protein [Rhizobium sp. BK251]TCL72934.1 LysR family transcriptional regulator [Rhizobium sp. BK251]
MDNRAGEMEIVVEAIRQGSFALAARQLALSPSAVSKTVTRVEERLGVRLLMRSTRALQLTPEGEIYFRQAQRILADIDETERMVVSGGKAVPRGRLRVSATVGFGTRFVVPLVPQFLARYPEVELDLSLSDGVVDLIGERTDVGIRAGILSDSGLKARKLIESQRAVIASPAYLERHGLPKRPEDLASHNCLGFNFSQAMSLWPFRDPATGERLEIPVHGNFLANSGATVRQLALAGLGIARIGQFHVQDDIDSGRLINLLEAFSPGDKEPVHAVFLGHAHLALRIRAFVDFLVDHIAKRARGS